MKIDHIRLYNLCLPFSFSFSHAAKDRSSARNVVVELKADRGRLWGYGEGAPRRYVTGETQEEGTRELQWMMKGNRFPWQSAWAGINCPYRAKNPNAFALYQFASSIDIFHICDYL